MGNLSNKRIIDFVPRMWIHEVEVDKPIAVLAGREQEKSLVEFVALSINTGDNIPVFFGQYVSDVVAS